MTQLDDERIERIRHGDADAFSAMVREHEHGMLCSAFRILGQQADAEEVRQCVLLRIWQSPQKLPSANRLAGWLHRCVVNESIARLRRKKREQLRDAQLAETLPSSVIEQKECEFERLRNAMAKLDPELRAILSLKFDEQMTVREIGDVLETPYTTIQSRLKKAVEKIRSLMQTTQSAERRR